MLTRQVRLWRHFPCLSVAVSEPTNKRQRAACDHHTSQFLLCALLLLCVHDVIIKHAFILKLQSAVYFITFYCCHCASCPFWFSLQLLQLIYNSCSSISLSLNGIWSAHFILFCFFLHLSTLKLVSLNSLLFLLDAVIIPL